jgi:DNA-binding Lrp family transcriptional regulator
MTTDSIDQLLLVAMQQGLPLTSRPYNELGKLTGISENEVLERLKRLTRAGIIKRMGLIVKHRQLGYHANAMVVWNIPDEEIQTTGRLISAFNFVNLCYQRPRNNNWQYNLYCMIHGKTKESVLARISQLEQSCALDYPREILFSRCCYKQRGAFYPVNTDG